jgi:hypothetical protein
LRHGIAEEQRGRAGVAGVAVIQSVSDLLFMLAGHRMGKAGQAGVAYHPQGILAEKDIAVSHAPVSGGEGQAGFEELFYRMSDHGTSSKTEQALFEMDHPGRLSPGFDGKSLFFKQGSLTGETARKIGDQLAGGSDHPPIRDLFTGIIGKCAQDYFKIIGASYLDMELVSQLPAQEIGGNELIPGDFNQPGFHRCGAGDEHFSGTAKEAFAGR